MSHNLKILLASNEVAGLCRELASRIDGRLALGETCRVLEDFAACQCELPAAKAI